MRLQKKHFQFTFIFLLSLIGGFSASAQYTINGSATQDDCHCYTLTPNLIDRHGTVWNNNRIDLNNSFDFTFKVFLGCSDNNGADGIAFVLQSINTSIGSSGGGGGMGFEGIAPSVAVTLDTYQNTSPDNDPVYDHIAIQLNGNLNHSSSTTTLTPLTPISATNNNVEDCQYHILRVVWDATTKSLSTYFDQQPRVSATMDFVNTVFAGTNLVYWGFSGATGGLSNLQKFCTTLLPAFIFSPTQKKCVGEPITFYDSTTAFSTIIKRYWNFGDGSPIDSISVNPIHIYTTAGTYNVELRVSTPDGCSAVFPQTVIVAGKPVASFSITDSCMSNNILFVDESTISNPDVIDGWYWDFDNAGQTSAISNPSTNYTTPGVKNIKFVVKTNLGCESDTLYQPINIYDRPVNDFQVDDTVCLGSPVLLTDVSDAVFGNVNFWNWNFSDSASPATVQNPVHIFTVPGVQSITLTTSSLGSNACMQTPKTKQVYVTELPQIDFQFSDTCKNAPVMFTSAETTTSLGIQNWYWDFGDGTQYQGVPATHTYLTNGVYPVSLYAISLDGCKSNILNEPITIYGTNAFAGKDTTVAANQPVQLNATGGINYEWSPSFGLSATNIQNPIATIDNDMVYYLKASTPGGCESRDTLRLTVYQGPEIYTPNAFTPNGDGLNDFLSPFIVGFQQLDHFCIFNRYSQLVYSHQYGTRGWDGKFKGQLQPTGTFVWVAEGIDYTGKKVLKKGTVLLIR